MSVRGSASAASSRDVRRSWPQRTRARRPHRTWPQRLLISFNVCAASSLAPWWERGPFAYAKRKVGQIDRVVIAQRQPGSWAAPGFEGDQPRNFLIVGADSDDGLDA